MKSPTFPFVGCFFVTFGPESKIQYQGFVADGLGDGHYLVRYFEAFMGTPNTCQVIHISDIVSRPPGDSRKPGSWLFFPDNESLLDWLETWGKKYR